MASLSMLLGVIGILLPLLPGTPFFILALYGFSKSSPKFQHWLLELPGIGDELKHWQAHKKIHKRRKPLIYISIIVSFSISILFINEHLLLQLMLLILMLILLLFIKKIPEC